VELAPKKAYVSLRRKKQFGVTDLAEVDKELIGWLRQAYDSA
jgi:hypothetical protein